MGAFQLLIEPNRNVGCGKIHAARKSGIRNSYDVTNDDVTLMVVHIAAVELNILTAGGGGPQ